MTTISGQMKPQRRARSAVALPLCVCVLASCGSAQEKHAVKIGQAGAQEVIGQLIQQTDVKVISNTTCPYSITLGPVSGLMTTTETLDRLLHPSICRYRWIDSHSIAIEMKPAECLRRGRDASCNRSG